MYIPIYAVENIVDEYIKILIKFEEESKMKYVEIKRYLVKVKVMNSITFAHNENIEQYDFTEENEAKKTNVLSAFFAKKLNVFVIMFIALCFDFYFTWNDYVIN